jgi:hypothetical protein
MRNRLYDYPKPAYAGSRKADDGFAVSAQPNGRLWVFVATNLFGNIAVPEFFLEIHPVAKFRLGTSRAGLVQSLLTSERK